MLRGIIPALEGLSMNVVCPTTCQTAEPCQLPTGYDNATLYGANWPVVPPAE